ncbi:hypothetical protein ISN45_At03g010680 [Arabidopsis thaliana x Arabidopsis arenosa]|uniref:Uncharacterized protein n=2 Tax=Arabidopsis TaxID=3701 RepID=A0A8T2F348_ARASU|nr:hypothetical protein ISN45_At03g010680 [Arabidopsis thaliana x Arabidopsis arenosa]KAG7630785.1 hypothetical protein ISN44_As03g010760 [Arabidopsis suecica]
MRDIDSLFSISFVIRFVQQDES